MKLTNHNKNNSYDIDTYVMRGTIEMYKGEFAEVWDYLCGCYKKANKTRNTSTRDSLRGVFLKDIKPLMSLGVTATSLIVKKYHLKGYKDHNYGIKLI